jgi:predicted RNA-binding Zn ribbon-like protein
LELVRRFLNTWKVPNDTRVPVDGLPGLLRDPSAREERFPGVPFGSGDTEELLAEMRDDLRGALGGAEGWEGVLDRWLRRYPMVARVRSEEGQAAVRYEATPEAGFAGWVASVVAQALEEGAWERLKICPDCRWVFYDRTRSKTKVWCGMFAGDGGRACGTIAKVKRYRQRRRGKAAG